MYIISHTFLLELKVRLGVMTVGAWIYKAICFLGYKLCGLGTEIV